ncbi:antitoxin [Kocuria sp.]|uniref:antitoxin n=1 Tax=Kocuria sp. TaxID=1871328 RepID=UPI0026E0B6F0|nr:antitoxin [Kocuria sp.]MDO5619342.1 antitoxin [Kocuria sp.]
MVDLGGFADKAKQAASDNPDAVNKGADFANDKTGGKYEDQINQAKDSLNGDSDNN